MLPWTELRLGPVTSVASGPLDPWTTTNSTVSPSPTLRRYLRGLLLMMDVQCTQMSSLVSLLVMKPYPFFTWNHFTFPVTMFMGTFGPSSDVSCCSSLDILWRAEGAAKGLCRQGVAVGVRTALYTSQTQTGLQHGNSVISEQVTSDLYILLTFCLPSTIYILLQEPEPTIGFVAHRRLIITTIREWRNCPCRTLGENPMLFTGNGRVSSSGRGGGSRGKLSPKQSIFPPKDINHIILLQAVKLYIAEALLLKTIQLS